jgi:hypothetical protein
VIAETKHGRDFATARRRDAEMGLCSVKNREELRVRGRALDAVFVGRRELPYKRSLGVRTDLAQLHAINQVPPGADIADDDEVVVRRDQFRVA